MVISTGVNERLRRFKLLDDVSPSRLYLLSHGRHFFLKLLLLRACLHQFLLQLFHLLVERTHGLQSGIMFPNTSDDPLLSNTTILKSLDTNQGLEKRERGTGVSQVRRR